MMKESESLEFTEFQETVFNGEDPVDSVKAFAEEKISNTDLNNIAEQVTYAAIKSKITQRWGLTFL